MKLTLGRFFDQHGAEMVVIDLGIEDLRAIAFDQQLGFERVGSAELPMCNR